MQSDPTRIDIDFRCDDLRLCGGVPRAHRGGCVTVRFAKTKARDLLETWIYHLGYAIAAPHAQPVSYLFCRDRVWKFETANDSQAIMKDLLSLFRAGMRGPTAFVPQTAYAFADALLNRTQPEDAAWRSARTAWQGNEYVDGEAHDPYVALCYRQRDPLSEDFKELALQVYGPLFDHLEPVLPGTVRQEKNPSCPGSSSPTNLEKNHK